MSSIIRIQMRRDTSINWSTVNPIMFQGESGLETDTGNIKMGDGIQTWNALPYMALYTPTVLAPDINLSSTDNYIRIYIGATWYYARLYAEI